MKALLITGLLLIACGAIFFVWKAPQSTGDIGLSPFAELGAPEEQELQKPIPVDKRRPDHGRRNPLDEVGTNVRIHDASSAIEAEVSIAAHPLCPDTVFAAYIKLAEGFGSRPLTLEVHRSFDRGQTWTHVHSTLSFGEWAIDPALSIDSNGRIYFAYVGSGTDLRVTAVDYSDNLGETWDRAEVRVSIYEDKPYGICDISPDSPFFGSYYLSWMDVSGAEEVWFAYSRGGEVPSFSEPVQISNSAQASHERHPYPAVGPVGEVYIAWLERQVDKLRIRKSTDGGVSFSEIGTIHENVSGRIDMNPCRASSQTLYPSIACDISNGPRRGWVYVAWSHPRGSSPGDGTDIAFSRSTDGGVSWSDPVIVNDGEGAYLCARPWLSIRPEDGVLAVNWLDTRDDPGHCAYHVYGAISGDGGATWTPNFAISDTASVSTQNTEFLGHYWGGTFARDGFYAIWTDLRHDPAGDTYVAWYSASTLAPPTGLTIAVSGSDLVLRWQATGAPVYKIFSADDSDGEFHTFVGSTDENLFTIQNALMASESSKFYQVFSAED